MSTEERIKKNCEDASNRGFGDYHVFADEADFVEGRLVGVLKYHSSWKTWAAACAVAMLQDNGKVYNRLGKLIE